MSNTTIKTQQTNQLPAGYKQTAVGIIPEDWEVEKLEKLGKVITGNTPSRSDLELWNGNFCWATAKDFKGKYIYDTNEKISEKGSFGARMLPSGSILITCIASIGNNAISKVPLATNQQINSIIVNDKNYNEWLYYQLEFFKSKMIQLAGKTAVPIINKSDFEKIKLPIPPLPEQQKIAEILSTWDNAIDNCKKIIKKLKKRNKGLAQQLLTGKTRVKGFEDMKWTELKANKIFKSHTDKTHNGDLEILSATQERGVIPRSMNNIDIKFDENSLGTYKKVEIGDFVISLRSFQGGIEYSEYEGIVSPAYTILKEILPISKSFYKVYFKTETFINRLNTIIYGIRDGKQISFGDFSTLNLPYPSIEEQEAITLILNASNEELKQYEQKLANLQLQKKGLMQQLLTGKVRVKI